jgi:hypothetical protein
MHRPLHVEDELPVNPYINARPEVPVAVVYLREREAKTAPGDCWDDGARKELVPS